MGKYLWCEDSKSGFQFWKAILHELYPEITVETKMNNTGLRKAVSRIKDDGNQYYIIMDSVVDNPDVLREMRRLLRDVTDKDNAHMIRMHSFEYALLSFELLESWVFAEEDALRVERESLLHTRKLFIKLVTAGGSSGELSELKKAFADFGKKNTEQLAARLLYAITRNTGFQTDKSKVGPCFICTCCEWKDRQADDICGLDENRISGEEKARLIVNRSVLREAFERAGLKNDNGL